MKEACDFSCWVIEYGRGSINGKVYQKDSLVDSDGLVVPLCWNHQHHDPTSVLGSALLEHSDEGIYAYCTLFNNSNRELVEQIVKDRDCMSSPYINKVKYDGKYITHGVIKEVSLVPARIDPDEAYYPVMRVEVRDEK